MKRRTLTALRADRAPEHHHTVYVVLLAPAAGRLAAVRGANPNRRRDKRCVNVGITGLTPEERFGDHKQGIKAAAVVQRFGIPLLPELCTYLNPMPYEAAAQIEKHLAEDLRCGGYTVTGGHLSRPHVRHTIAHSF